MSPWLEGLQIAFQWDNLLYVLIGTVLGVLFGVLPGVGAIQGMALLLPLTFGLEPASALIILGGMFGGSIYGGAITSILINTPGDPTSAATTFDGYPMARKGQAGVAIGAATAVSTFGNLAGIAVLMVAAPPLARVALKFGPPEYFSLAVLGLTVIAVAARESVLKGLVSAGLGLFLSFVGMSLALGYPRFTYGISYLDDGLPFVSLTVGIFAVSEALMLIERGGRIAEVGKVVGGVWEGAVKAFHYPVTLIRSVLIGIWLGILPGVGATTANFVAYMETVRTSKNPKSFGTGNIEGVIAPEASNNAVVGAALIPTLTLGIPGSAASALLLGGLILHGINPGPRLFQQDAHITYAFFFGLILSSWIFFAVGMLLANQFAKITLVPTEILGPLILVLAVLAAYADRHSFGDIIVAVVSGVGAYFFRRYGYSLVCFIIAFVLGPIAEMSFYQSMILSDDSLLIFVSRPLSGSFLAVGVAALVWPSLRKHGAKLFRGAGPRGPEMLP